MITHLKDRFNEEELKQALESMLSEMGWDSLRQVVESKRRFLGRFTAGGFQLKAQNVQRARNVILKAAEKEDYERLFFFWCHDKDDLRSVLDAWSETDVAGDETDTEETEGNREMSEENFEKLIGCIKNQEGRYFLCFSPVVFTLEQESSLLESLSREDTGTHIPEETSRQESRAEKIISEAKAEIKELKAQLRKEQHENKRLSKERGSFEERAKEIELELKNAREMARQHEERIARLENAENERIVRLETRIAGQKKELKGMEEMLDGLRIELRQKEGDADRLKEEKASIERRFKSGIGDVLSELNASDIIRSLNEPDEVKDLLLSVVRIPVSDETARRPAKPTDIMEFWRKLLEGESASVKILGEITLEAASERDFSNQWADLSDRLVDLKYSLRARAVLIGFFYEILSKFYDINEYTFEETPAPQPISPVVHPRRSIFAEEVETLGLDQRILKGIRSKNIFTVADLVRKKEHELLRIKNFGRKDLERLKEALGNKGLRLGMTVPDSL